MAPIQKDYALTPRYDRLRATGMLTLEEMAHTLNVSPRTVRIWRIHGLVHGDAYTDKGDRLYAPPGADAPSKAQGVKLSRRRPAAAIVPHGRKEVQCET